MDFSLGEKKDVARMSLLGRRWPATLDASHQLGGRARLHPSRPPSRMRQQSTRTRFPSSAGLCVVGSELVAAGGNKVRSHHVDANRSLPTQASRKKCRALHPAFVHAADCVVTIPY